MRLDRLFPVAAVCLPLSLAACGGSDDAALVGTFVECDGSGSQFVFGANGSYRFEEDGDVETGTYSADGDTLTIHSEDQGTPVELRMTYYVNDTHFVFGAAYPDGDHDGLVGTWNGDMRIDEGGALSGAATTIVLDADNTGSIRQVPYDGSETYERDGTWAPDEDENNLGGYELIIQETDNVTLRMSFQIVDDAVLGSPRYCRANAG